jgi:small conductance mechanosensitive channel
MQDLDFSKYFDQIISLAVEYSPKALMALLTLLVGFWLIKKVVRISQLGLEKKAVDQPLVYFLSQLVNIGLKGLLLISVASMIGIETTSFIAVFGAAGLAIGLALQGSLSNFAGGVLILLFKPYKIGDLVEAQGHLGVVKAIQIFNTILVDPNNKRVVIPNGAISNASIVNFSAEGQLRVDMSVGVSYNADLRKAKETIENVLKADKRILADPAYTVAVSELADSGVIIVFRPYCLVADYWGVYFDTIERVKLALDDAGISIPFPQRDVHIYKHEA